MQIRYVLIPPFFSKMGEKISGFKNIRIRADRASVTHKKKFQSTWSNDSVFNNLFYLPELLGGDSPGGARTTTAMHCGFKIFKMAAKVQKFRRLYALFFNRYSSFLG